MAKDLKLTSNPENVMQAEDIAEFNRSAKFKLTRIY
jgi:hypothetical protein